LAVLYPQVHPFEGERGAESGAEHAEIAGWDVSHLKCHG